MDGAQAAQQAFDFSSGDLLMMAVLYACLAFVFAMNGAISFYRRGGVAIQGAMHGAVFAFMLWGLLVITIALIR